MPTKVKSPKKFSSRAKKTVPTSTDTVVATRTRTKSPRTKPPLMTKDGTPVTKIWKQFKKNGSEELRQVLAETYLHLVRYNSERVHSKLPSEVDVQDLFQAGYLGLRDAIEAFDLSRGIKFETYCAPRIRGAILDELRSMDWVPRLVRSRTSKIESARKALASKLGCEPTEDEIARELNVGMDDLKKIIKDGRAVGVVSLNRKWYETDSNKDVREIDVLKDERQVDPFVETQKNDLKDLVTKGLSRAERLIVVLYYYEQMTMKEIGSTLDLSESRVSQMHSSILARLRAHLLHREPEFRSD